MQNADKSLSLYSGARLLAPGYSLTVGCTGLTEYSLPILQVGVHLREGIPVHRHGSELRLQQNEGRGLHQHQWQWEGLGCRRLCLSLPGWLVARSVHFGQFGLVGEAKRWNVFVTWPLIGKRFAGSMLWVTVSAGDRKRQQNYETNCLHE